MIGYATTYPEKSTPRYSRFSAAAAQRLAADPELAALAQTFVAGPALPPLPEFIRRTKIEVPHAAGASIVPFELWPAQLETVLPALDRERLLLFLKARQLGLSWVVCAFVLYQCLKYPAQTWLLFSQGQDEADELLRRIGFLYSHYDTPAELPGVVKDNTEEWVWENGSRVLSRAATKKAGRSFTASGVVLDEFAFMLHGPQVLSAAKPTIDAGGKMVIISSADGNGTPYHQLCLGAKAGTNGFTFVFLPWTAHPGRDTEWRERMAAESPDMTVGDVLREYPATDEEAFTNATGLVYGDVYDDSAAGNVTEAADYIEGAGDVYWLVDDGYSAGAAKKTQGIDPHTGMYVADAHPRVILWAQIKPDGHLDIFDESYACLTLSNKHIADALDRQWPAPLYAIHGPGAAEIAGQLFEAGIMPSQGGPSVEESIKVYRRMLAPDANGWRRVRFHPRCVQLRREHLAYRYAADGRPVKAFDHGPDAVRVGVWVLQNWL